jgi:hypothetical protein
MIVIEQNVERGLALADHVAVLEKGRVALTGEPAQMRADDRLLSLYIGEAKGAGSAASAQSQRQSQSQSQPVQAQTVQAQPGTVG